MGGASKYVVPAQGDLCTTVITMKNETLLHAVVPAEGDLCTTVIPAEAGTHPLCHATLPALKSVVPAEGDLCTTVIPAEAGTHPRRHAMRPAQSRRTYRPE